MTLGEKLIIAKKRKFVACFQTTGVVFQNKVIPFIERLSQATASTMRMDFLDFEILPENWICNDDTILDVYIES